MRGLLGRLALAGLALAALGLLPGPRAQGLDPARLLSAIPGEVMFLRQTGSWSLGERRGPTRMIVLRTDSPDGAMRLFVQWLAADRRTGRHAVIATEEVSEVFDWRIKIDDYRIHPEPNGARVIIDAVVITSNLRRGYDLVIGPPGEVMFSARR